MIRYKAAWQLWSHCLVPPSECEGGGESLEDKALDCASNVLLVYVFGTERDVYAAVGRHICSLLLFGHHCHLWACGNLLPVWWVQAIAFHLMTFEQHHSNSDAPLVATREALIISIRIQIWFFIVVLVMWWLQQKSGWCLTVPGDLMSTGWLLGGAKHIWVSVFYIKQ